MSRGIRRLLNAAFVLLILGTLVTQLGACHTIKGFGRDIESMGQGGQDLIDGKK